MPALFSLAIHNALVEAKSEMGPDEQLCAFLDDIYALSSPDRTHDLYELLGVKLASAGIRLHTRKTRCWNRSGVPPPNMAELGPDVWSPQGVKILGTPVGSAEFIEEATQRRLEEERILWGAIPSVPDIQCAWQILLQCAGPRCHHWLRTVPPSCSATYAVGHDVGMMNTMDALFGGLPGDAGQQEMAHTLASLPMRLGGLGLRSAARMALAAYWASWADALPMIAEGTSVGELKECVEDQLTMQEVRAKETQLGSIARVREAP